MEATQDFESLPARRTGVFLTHEFLNGRYTRTGGVTRPEVARLLAEDDRNPFLPPTVRQWVEHLFAAGLLWPDPERPGFVSTLVDAQLAGFLHGCERDAETAHRLEGAGLPERYPPVCRDVPITIAQFLGMAGVSPDVLIDGVPGTPVNVAAWFDLGPAPGEPSASWARAVLEIQRPEVTYRLHVPVEERP